MKKPSEGPESESPMSRVTEILGEPAVVINGVPNVTVLTDNTLRTCDPTSDAESEKNSSFGFWLEGRAVQKPFGKNIYSGSVTKFDKETGWYRVVYEDGDFEDLELHELEEIIVPLDITIPLKDLAQFFLRKNVTLGNVMKRTASEGSIRRTRGRPRKDPVASELEASELETERKPPSELETERKPRGRPRKASVASEFETSEMETEKKPARRPRKASSVVSEVKTERLTRQSFRLGQ